MSPFSYRIGREQALSEQGMVGERSGGYLLTFVVALFVTTLITANITAVKLFGVLGPVLTAGVVVFPISYVLGDVLTKVYGFRTARGVIWLGFLCNFIAVAAIYVGRLLPPAPIWDAQSAYERILGYTPRLFLASFAVYLVGGFAKSYVLAKLKVATDGRHFWARTIGSSLVGQGPYSSVFVLLAFAGAIPLSAMVTAILAQWLVKSAYQALATPFSYLVVNRLKRREGVDVYDRDTSFNPLSMAR